MPADRKQVEEALFDMREVVKSHANASEHAFVEVVLADLRLLLTDHAALLARAEAAEAALQYGFDLYGYDRCDGL